MSVTISSPNHHSPIHLPFHLSISLSIHSLRSFRPSVRLPSHLPPTTCPQSHPTAYVHPGALFLDYQNTHHVQSMHLFSPICSPAHVLSLTVCPNDPSLCLSVHSCTRSSGRPLYVCPFITPYTHPPDRLPANLSARQSICFSLHSAQPICLSACAPCSSFASTSIYISFFLSTSTSHPICSVQLNSFPCDVVMESVLLHFLFFTSKEMFCQ